MLRPTLFTAFTIFFLAACQGTTPDEQTLAAEQAKAAAEAAAEAEVIEPVVEGGCDDTQAQWTVGKAVTEAEVEQARQDAGAETVRTIKPDQMVTMDFNSDRLNLDMDEAGTVTAARCG